MCVFVHFSAGGWWAAWCLLRFLRRSACVCYGVPLTGARCWAVLPGRRRWVWWLTATVGRVRCAGCICVARAWSPCTGRCGAAVPPGVSRCEGCDRAADRARGDRGYGSRGHRLFREAVLARDPMCKVCGRAWSTVADHHPIARRDLVDMGRDPDDPSAGRGLCKGCHDRETARLQPGGWNLR